jgi:DNA-binding protein Fis
LQNYVERAVIMAEGDELTYDLLPGTVTGKQRARRGQIRGVDLDSLIEEVVQQGLADAGTDAENLHARIVDRVERELITQVMTLCNDVQIKAAARLGINRNTLHKKLKDYQIGQDDAPTIRAASSSSNRDKIAATSALAGLVVPRCHAAGDATIKLALIGCGGRGTGAVSDAFHTRAGRSSCMRWPTCSSIG